MSTETPETPVAATPPTPENVAEMLTSGDNDYHDGNYWHPSLYAQGNVVSIGITPYADDDEGTKLPEVHFRAVVVEGETAPIVLERPALADVLEFEGEPYHADDDSDGWQVCAAAANGRATQVVFADSVLFRGCGHISTTEARRMAAALVAMADAVEAAQAQTGGAQ